jgi:hypothetical protein
MERDVQRQSARIHGLEPTGNYNYIHIAQFYLNQSRRQCIIAFKSVLNKVVETVASWLCNL